MAAFHPRLHPLSYHFLPSSRPCRLRSLPAPMVEGRYVVGKASQGAHRLSVLDFESKSAADSAASAAKSALDVLASEVVVAPAGSRFGSGPRWNIFITLPSINVRDDAIRRLRETEPRIIARSELRSDFSGIRYLDHPHQCELAVTLSNGFNVTDLTRALARIFAQEKWGPNANSPIIYDGELLGRPRSHLSPTRVSVLFCPNLPDDVAALFNASERILSELGNLARAFSPLLRNSSPVNSQFQRCARCHHFHLAQNCPIGQFGYRLQATDTSKGLNVEELNHFRSLLGQEVEVSFALLNPRTHSSRFIYLKVGSLAAQDHLKTRLEAELEPGSYKLSPIAECCSSDCYWCGGHDHTLAQCQARWEAPRMRFAEAKSGVAVGVGAANRAAAPSARPPAAAPVPAASPPENPPQSSRASREAGPRPPVTRAPRTVSSGRSSVPPAPPSPPASRRSPVIVGLQDQPNDPPIPSPREREPHGAGASSSSSAVGVPRKRKARNASKRLSEVVPRPKQKVCAEPLHHANPFDPLLFEVDAEEDHKVLLEPAHPDPAPSVVADTSPPAVRDAAPHDALSQTFDPSILLAPSFSTVAQPEAAPPPSACQPPVLSNAPPDH